MISQHSLRTNELSIEVLSEIKENQDRKKQKLMGDVEKLSYNMQNLIFALENREKKCEELENQLEIYNSFSIEKKVENLECLSRSLIKENERISQDLKASRAINASLLDKVTEFEKKIYDFNEISAENLNLKVPTSNFSFFLTKIYFNYL
jgi:hypothetical protein